MNHIAIMNSKDYIDKILNKEKIIESRFSKNKITPYNKINVGDTIYLKESGKDITAKFKVEKVLYFDNLNSNKIKKLKKEYNKYVVAPDSYWDSKINSNYGTLIYIKDPENIGSIKINKKSRNAFVSNVNIEGK